MMRLLHPFRQQTDEDLMERAATGSDRAFEELYRRHARRLQGFFFRQTGGDAELAADLTQDTFLRAYDSRQRWQTGQQVAPWLFTIAYNLCRNMWRHNQTEAEYLNRLDREPSEDATVEVTLDANRLDEALRHVLDRLPREARALFSLHYEEDLTVPQLAQMYHVPEGTIKSRLHKTITIIRKQLKNYETF